MVAHRGNLNYQDCRRTLTAGFEESDIELLREVLQPCEDMGDMGSSRMPGLVVAASSDMNTAAQAESAAPGGSVPGGTVASSDIGGSVPDVSSTTGGSVPFGSRGNALLGFLADTCTVMGSDMKDKKEHVRFRVKITSAFILTAEWWRTLSFVWSGTLEESDRTHRRASEFLTKYLTGAMCRAMSMACSSLDRLEYERTGAADASRVGDRFLTVEQRTLHHYVKECVVEGIRTGIQTSFYTCDYTTKPALTCGPVLRHLTHGMRALEERMQAEAQQEEARRLQMNYPLPAAHEGRGLTPEQKEARRRLCRLWTSANHAVMHGFCLMSLQLLTGREVLRTHIFWRIMLKRVLWGIFEEMRRNTTAVDVAVEAESALPLTDIDLVTASTGERTDARATSFYEDYLHRGVVEPLASMNLYVYAMHVSAVPVQEGGKFEHGEFDFEAHYVRAKTHVQVLHAAARIPYLHGISMPTKQKDPEMHAAVHVALLQQHACQCAKECGKSTAVKHIHVFPRHRHHRVVAPGMDVRAAVDRTGVLATWKATEARIQCLADRADAPWF